MVSTVPSTADAPGAGSERTFVEATLVSLGSLDELPVAEHAAVYDLVHRNLADILEGGVPDLQQDSALMATEPATQHGEQSRALAKGRPALPGRPAQWAR